MLLLGVAVPELLVGLGDWVVGRFRICILGGGAEAGGRMVVVDGPARLLPQVSIAASPPPMVCYSRAIPDLSVVGRPRRATKPVITVAGRCRGLALLRRGRRAGACKNRRGGRYSHWSGGC